MRPLTVIPTSFVPVMTSLSALSRVDVLAQPRG